MRTLIISDIHANLTALQAVVDSAKPYDRVWCLGDVVGYGPDPNECISFIREFPQLICVKGNHDAAIIGDINIASFNYEARASLVWLSSVLDPTNEKWLKSLDERVVNGGFTLVHGSPSSPVWEYVMDARTAYENMDSFETKYCLVGHTHIPNIYELENQEGKSVKTTSIKVGEPQLLNSKCIINPGSVGQPRDNDPRASYVIYDDEEDKFTYFRVPYDIEQVQNRIIKAGLPGRHAYRLSKGW